MSADSDRIFRLVEETQISTGERTKWRLWFEPMNQSEESQVTVTVSAETYLRFNEADLYSWEEIMRSRSALNSPVDARLYRGWASSDTTTLYTQCPNLRFDPRGGYIRIG